MSTAEVFNVIASTTAMPLSSSSSERLLQRQESSREEIMTQKSAALRTWIIILELIWSSMIISAVSVVLDTSKRETTKVPLRLWIVGYGVLRVVYTIGVCLDYWHWKEVSGAMMFGSLDVDNTTRHSTLGRVTKCLQSVNSVLNLIWWIYGLYWIFSGGKMLADDAPKQFWFTAIFLVLDLFIVLISAVMPCIFYGAGCCRLPVDQNGAIKDLVDRLTANNSRKLETRNHPMESGI